MKKESAKILVADDNPDIRRLIQVNLEFEGYSTVIAKDGIEALSLAREHLPDLIILDVLMPGMDGWQVLASLKDDKITRDIPVILLTGVSMKEGKERGLIEGVEDFLSKPFNPLRLLEIVDELVSTHKVSGGYISSGSERIKLGLVGSGKSGLNMVKALSGASSIIELTAFCEVDSSLSSTLARNLGVFSCFDPFDLLQIEGLDLIIDTREELDKPFYEKAREKNIEFIQGVSSFVIRVLLEERELSYNKERSLVKELNTRVKELSILNEMAQLLTSPLDLWFLLDKILVLTARVANVDACAVMVYQEELEKFAVSHTLGMDEDFKNVKISLSDPITEELLSLRRPLVISQIRDWRLSPLIRASLKAGMNSMAVIPFFSKARLLGIILVFSTTPQSFNKEDISLLSNLAGQAGIAVDNAYLYENTIKKSQLVEKLLSKLIQAQEDESKRIAAEIHDTIAQSLVGIYTRIQTCQALLKKAPEKLESQLKELKEVVGDNVKEVRQIIFNLRPSSLDDLGLIPSVENYIKRFEEEHGISVEFRVNKRDKRLPPSMETAIFRIIQEALNNIKKHSQGKQAIVRLSFEPKWVQLRVADDGRGFNWEEVTEKFLKGDSHGIQGMKERVSVFGGNFKVTTERGSGCIVSAAIPLNRQSREKLLNKSDLSLLGRDFYFKGLMQKGV